MRGALILVGVACGVASAQPVPPPAPVNLLVSGPSTIAVSSTVANAKILPQHLVDGKLDTAWNSRTGELVGSWIAVRLPAAAKVTSIRLTAGFTRADKRGDLFTMNPRIKKVRVSRDSKLVVEHVLDPERRTLQEIPVQLAGGDFKIEVVEIVAGSKRNWREISVSELEVWGTPAVPVKKAKPTVLVGSFDAPALTAAECVRVAFPDGKKGRTGPDKTDDKITGTEVLTLSPDVVICRVDHVSPATPTTTDVDIVAVRRTPRTVELSRTSSSFVTEDRPADGGGDKGGVTLSVFPLTPTENALLIATTQAKYGPMTDDGTKSSSLWRLTAAGIVQILDFESTWSGGEADRSDRCELALGKSRKGMPDLELACTHSEGNWHNDDPSQNGITEATTTTRYRWKGTTYEPL